MTEIEKLQQLKPGTKIRSLLDGAVLTVVWVLSSGSSMVFSPARNMVFRSICNDDNWKEAFVVLDDESPDEPKARTLTF